MEDSLLWLAAANVAVWAGTGLYLIFMARQQRLLDKRLRQLELLRDE
ncbi:MAG: CcmD family protein [Desulfovibrionaceae bacterium]|nr:CcmD family protein [Desulfovibrionaceae bacterium]